ncbi:unnamed protein product [Vitrella brassicaformis CCMP3155]|uniref:Uncharacterized protein n=1 Tax=Vitrella brassicaformis (strain CCMP3155) TaxID=1169540 RepID=A0A0G4H8F4_VITBC|nr:unnamed protein product [Vitrella brassicaformis CCMP3155]|eukprot:CEM40150.1 unnamed protein product [Vitrella brassicaformis CCMP3155]
MKAVCDYGREKGVGVMLLEDCAGVEDTADDYADLTMFLDNVKTTGVVGVKFDFFNNKEAVEAAKQHGDAFVKLPLLPPLLPWGYLQPAIPKAPAAMPFVPSYKPYGAASLVTKGESMVVFPTLRQMTPPSLGVPVYGGSSEAVNMLFVREYRAILHTREREVDLTDAWLGMFDEFKTLTRKVTVYANSFLKAVAVKVSAKRPSFDVEQYSAYVDLVAMYAYGDLRQLDCWRRGMQRPTSII